MLQHLEPEARMATCHELIDTVHNEDVLECVRDLVNRHNIRLCADEQPHVAMDLECNTPKVNVWMRPLKFTFTAHSF